MNEWAVGTNDWAERLCHSALALPLPESALGSLSSVALSSAQVTLSLPALSYFRQFVVLTTGSTIAYVLLYSISLYALFMQFFQDQYFSLLSTWLQYLFLIVSYFWILPKLENRKTAAESHSQPSNQTITADL